MQAFDTWQDAVGVQRYLAEISQKMLELQIENWVCEVRLKGIIVWIQKSQALHDTWFANFCVQCWLYIK